MPLSVEIVVALVVAFGAIITLWYDISSRKIREITRDLQAGESARVEYVIRQIPEQLEPRLSAAVSDLRKLEKKPNPRLTAGLKKDLEGLVSLVEEINSIQDAQTKSVSCLRNVRDRGLFAILGFAIMVFVWVVSTYLSSSLSDSTVGMLLFFGGYLVFGFIVVRIYPLFRTYNRIKTLLNKNELYTVGE